MNDLTGERIGFVVTGSFCTFSAAFAEAAKLRAAGAELTPIFSEHAAGTDTRFGKAADRVAELEEICGRKAIRTIPDAEPLGPKNMLDLLVVAPCTANTAAKLAYGITDNTATMAVKSMLRAAKTGGSRRGNQRCPGRIGEKHRAAAEYPALLLRSPAPGCAPGKAHFPGGRLLPAAGDGGAGTGGQTDSAHFWMKTGSDSRFFAEIRRFSRKFRQSPHAGHKTENFM